MVKRYPWPKVPNNPGYKLDPDKRSISGFGGCNSLMGVPEYEAENYPLPTTALEDVLSCCVNLKKDTNALRNTDAFKLDGEVLHLLHAGKEVAALNKAK